MQRDQAYLLDILKAAELALAYVKGVSEERFIADTQLQDSVIRRFEILGEAARRVSPETQTAHLSIPWREMIGMRNMMIHDYDDVDLHVVWQTVQQDLPQLIVAIKALLSTTGP
jgi:uncharacterized protein with HEPN domain